MNERIQELMAQAGFDPAAIERMGVMPQAKKFAELIVKECISISESHAKNLESQPCDPAFEQYEDGVVNGIYEATAVIKEHFGVKE